MKKLFLLSVLLIAFGCAHLDEKCIVRKAAFDVGSGATNMKVADVNVCTQKIVHIILEKQEKVDYKDDLQKNGGKFSQQIKQTGYEALKKLKEEAIKNKVNEKYLVGVATSAFRDSKNSKQFIKKITDELGLKITVISQEEEGILGFYSALTQVKVPVDEMVVWDIGGGSMQIVTRKNQNFVVFKGDLASVSFKNRVIKEVKKSKAITPNPLTRTQQIESVKIANNNAERVNADIKEKIKNVSGKVLGIGSVLGISVKNQTGKEKFSSDDLNHALESQSNKTDEMIGGKYASTDVTNLALVEGYMSALGISEVQVVKVNNADGVLINPRY